MKKILCQIALFAVSISASEKVFADALMKQAFPTPGFTKCYSNRAKIDWNAVQRIEQSEGKAGINKVTTYVMQNIQPCMQDNPNFVKKLTETCSGSEAVAQNQQWLCQAVGVNLKYNAAGGGGQAQSTTTLAISSNQADNLAMQAIPKSSNFFDRCSKQTGRVNWSMVKQLVNNGYKDLVENRLDQVTKPCIKDKNENMVSILAQTCQIVASSPQQHEVCTQVANIQGQPNPAAQQPPQEEAAQNAQQPVVGQVVQQQNADTQTQMAQNAGTQTMPQQPQIQMPQAPTCPNLNAEKADLAKKQAELETYKKSLEDFRDQLTQIREQLVAYQQQLQAAENS